MPTFSPDAGVSEREPTLLPDGACQDVDGAEYRVGEIGLFVARGRDLQGTISGVTGVGLYEAGFDANDYVVAHVGNSYHAALIEEGSLTFSLFDNLPTDSLPVVGAHYANRHYTANGVANRRIELSASGVTSFPIGMSATTFVMGTSVLQGVSTMSATTGLEYWVTEYDSTRGIESVFGTTANTGAFSLKDGVVVRVTGVSANPRADQLRWYRSVDGGGYPDGGLINTTAIGTTSITDTLFDTGTLTVPQYGIISVGGNDTDRDEAPPVLSTIFGPYQDSLLGVAVGEPRVLRFTPAGYPDSWPGQYGIPLQTPRHDEIIAGCVLSGRIGLFCNDAVYVVYRLPRDSDSIFAAGEAQDVVTDQRGTLSRRGVCTFIPIGGGALAAFVARDGIWATNLVPSQSPFPLTDQSDWEGRVDISNLSSSRLVDDPANRRFVFLYRRVTDTTHNTGVWYFDYQRFADRGIRVTYADHGPLADAVTIPAADGVRRLVSIDSRSGNGQVYLESSQDVDDSQLLDSSGSVRFRMRTKEFLPGGPRGAASIGAITWMHDAGPAQVTHRFYFNRRDSNPEVKTISEWDERKGSVVQGGGRNINSLSVEIESVGTVSYGVHWIDVEGLDLATLGSREGA